MDNTELTEAITTLKAERMVDSALLHALLLTHQNRALLASAWKSVRMESLASGLAGNPTAQKAFSERAAHWTELVLQDAGAQTDSSGDR